jgi:hypothetical protein
MRPDSISSMPATIKRFRLCPHLLRNVVNMKLNLTVILTFILRGHETSSVMLKKEQELTLRGLTAALIKNQVLWDVTSYRLTVSDLHFGGK